MNPMEPKKFIETEEDREKSRLFKDELLKFNTLHGRENFKVPQIGGKELDLYRLYKEVVNRGGSCLVSENKQWKEIVNALELPASCTSASFTLRNHYNRCLHAYESYFIRNQSIAPSANNAPSSLSSLTNPNISNLTAQAQLQAQVHSGGSEAIRQTQNPIAIPNNPSLHLINNINLVNSVNTVQLNSSNQPSIKKEEQFLGKKIIRPETEYNLIFRYQGKPQAASRDKSYQKKVRILNAVPDMRKVVLAFESHVTSEIVWALNTLLLFSSNSACALQLENQPYLIESMTNYLYYCINNISEMFYLIEIAEGNVTKSTKSENSHFSNSASTNALSNITALNSSLTASSLKYEINQLLSTYSAGANQMSNISCLSAHAQAVAAAGYKDASTRLQNKRLKSFNESTTFHFLDEINKTISLAAVAKKGKNLLEIEKKKAENHINLHLEEVSEYELMEHVSCIIQIIRNLSFLKVNESAILKCQKFTSMLYLLFIWTNLQDLKANCLDIITNLSRHISLKDLKFPSDLLHALFEFLKNPNRELSEQALECLRRLTFPSGNDEFFEKMQDEFFEELNNLLLAYKLEIREAAVEILYFLSDQKLPTKTRLGKQPKCVQRLVAIVCANTADSKISKWAVCTLAKLAEVPSILKIINCYEQELFFAACTDESISRIVMGILSNS